MTDAPVPAERRIRSPLDPRNPLSGVYLATMLFELAEGGLRFLLPLDLDSRGIGPEGIGLVLAVFSFTSLISRGIAGGAFRYDRARRLIVVAGLSSSVAFLLVPFADTAVGAALLMAADGFGWGVATTVLLAVVMTVTPSTMSAAVAMGWYVGFQGIALALATTVGGLLAQALGLQLAMLTLATVPAIAGILISLRLPPASDFPAEPPAGALRDDGEDEDIAGPELLRPVRRWAGAARRTLAGLPAVVWAAALVAAYLNVMNGLLQGFFPLLGIALGLTLAQVGTLSSIRVGVSSLARFGAGWLFARVPARLLHLPLLTLSAVTVMVLPWVGGSYLLAAPVLALNGISRGFLRVTTGAAAMEALRGRNPGAAAAVMTAGLDVGKMVGPLIGGVIAATFGLEVMFVVVPLVFLALYASFDLVAVVRRRRAPGPTATA